MLALALENEAPEQPEVLSILRQARRFNIPVFNGSFHDWPYHATQEMNAAIEAEIEHKNLLALNVKARLAMEAKNANPT